MPNLYSAVEQLIGNTPLLHLARYEKEKGLTSKLFAKLEYLNPAGSAKDRIGLSLIQDADEKGLLQPTG